MQIEDKEIVQDRFREINNIYKEVAEELGVDVKLVKHLGDYQFKQGYKVAKDLSYSTILFANFISLKFNAPKFFAIHGMNLHMDKKNTQQLKTEFKRMSRLGDKRLGLKIK
jgi:hypothetical protein